jgi:CRP/FNR family transcriptional regulator
MKIDVEKLISHAAFFRGISDEGRKLLVTICVPKRIPKKEILFHEGEKGHSIFLLAMGSIRLSKATADGEEVVIKVVGLHEVFAEVILFEEELYPVTATALTDSVVLQIPKREVHQLLNKESFRNDFIRFLMKKQRYLARQIHLFHSADVKARLLHFLRDQYGDREEIPMTISKKDVAEAIGTTPETLSRLLQRLKKSRQLTWSGHTIRLAPGFWSKVS